MYACIAMIAHCQLQGERGRKGKEGSSGNRMSRMEESGRSAVPPVTQAVKLWFFTLVLMKLTENVCMSLKY